MPAALAKIVAMMIGEIDMTMAYLRNYQAGNLNLLDLVFVCSFILLISVMFVNLTVITYSSSPCGPN